MPAIEHAYLAAQRVYRGELPQQKAAELLESDHQINVNSAKIMIAVYGKMVQGLEFKRALSAPDMNYYLGRFLAEGGANALLNPTAALLRHIEYYEARNSVNLNALREIHGTYAAIARGAQDIERIDREFNAAVVLAAQLPVTERRRRAAEMPERPAAKPIMVMVYERNPYVVAEVLARAGDACEQCGCAAPFLRRRDNSPYLEVHHVVRLADGGLDTVENAVALCPNCHRQNHFG
jgi:5-methylcytosine-specific restriction protein A